MNEYINKDNKKGFFSRRRDNIISTTKKVVGAETIKDGATTIKTYSKILNPFKKHESIRLETFDDSYARFNMTEEKLEVIYKNLTNKFYMSFFIMVLILIWMVILALDGNVITAVATLSIASIAAAVSLTTAFRLHQLYVRKWCSFKEWFENEDGWWPKTWEQAVIVKEQNEQNNIRNYNHINK